MKKIITWILCLCTLFSLTAFADHQAETNQAFLDNFLEHCQAFDPETQQMRTTVVDTDFTYLMQMQDGIVQYSMTVDGEEYAVDIGEEMCWVKVNGNVYEIPYAELKSLLQFRINGQTLDEIDTDGLRQIVEVFYAQMVEPNLTYGEGEVNELHFDATFKALAHGLARAVDTVLKDERMTAAVKSLMGKGEQADEMFEQITLNWPSVKLMLATYRDDTRLTADITETRSGYKAQITCDDGMTVEGYDIDIDLSTGYPNVHGVNYLVENNARRDDAVFDYKGGKYTTTFTVTTIEGDDFQFKYVDALNVKTFTANVTQRALELLNVEGKRVTANGSDEFILHGTLSGDTIDLSMKRSDNAIDFRGSLDGMVLEGAARWQDNYVPTYARIHYSDSSYYYINNRSFDIVYDGEKVTITDAESRMTMTFGAKTPTRYAVTIENRYFDDLSLETLHVYYDIVDRKDGWQLFISADDGELGRVIIEPKTDLPLLRDQDPRPLTVNDFGLLLNELYRFELPENRL